MLVTLSTIKLSINLSTSTITSTSPIHKTEMSLFIVSQSECYKQQLLQYVFWLCLQWVQ